MACLSPLSGLSVTGARQLKKRCKKWELRVNLSLGTAAQETEPQIALEGLLRRGSVGGGRYVWFWWRRSSRHSGTVYERFSASNEELMAPWRDLVLFQTWRDARIGIMKSVPENIWLAKDLFRVSLEHRVPRSPTWREFRAGQRSAAAPAQDPVSTEAGGRCPWQVTVTGPCRGNRFHHTWGGISWPFHPTLLGMLSGEDFIDKHSVCYYWTRS